MRLDRYLCKATALTRSQAQKMIRSGAVSVNEVVVRDPSAAWQAGAVVRLAGEPVEPLGPRYFMLNKPAGYVCARHDALHPVALDLIHEPQAAELHLVGRLDRDTTGLLLITDDGDWSHRVTSPRKNCAKTYFVKLAEPLHEPAVDTLRQGVMLRGENRPTRPAGVELLGPCECRLTIQEGRYHQIKRMLAAVGNRVIALHREKIGQIQLDTDLSAGEYRSLSAAEIASVG